MNRLIVALIIGMVAIPLSASAIECPGGNHMMRMDANGDGSISAEEHAAMAAARFAEMDTNGDGKVTRDELQAYHEQMQKCRGGNRGMSGGTSGSTTDNGE